MLEKSKVYVVNGDPIPLARARHHTRGYMYDSQKTVKLVWKISLTEQHYQLAKFTGPIHIEMCFYMPIPKNAARKLDSYISKPHYFKPDLDNMIKYVCDVSDGILFDNDCIISSITAVKLYDLNPRTEFTISKMNNQNIPKEECDKCQLIKKPINLT